MLYKYRATLCNQHETPLEANEDNKATVLCAYFSQTVYQPSCIVFNYLPDM